MNKRRISWEGNSILQRVLLINPEETRGRFDFKGIIDDEPLEIELIYTVLKQHDIECRILDMIRPRGETLESVLESFEPTITYVNGIVKQVPFIKEYHSRIKKINHEIKTIVGGSYAEHNYEILYDEQTDFICRSYDPFVLVKIAKSVGKEKTDYKEINGLCYKENQRWMKNELVPFDINLIPEVDRTYFYEHIDEFRYLELTKAAQVRTSYSCPYKCSFCYRTSLNCGKYSPKDIEKVVREIKNIKSNHIYIVDDDFLFSEERIKTFIDLIRKEGIKKRYICYGRTDFIIKHKELIKELKDIGFYYMLVGLESISDEKLTSYNKKTGASQNAECVQFLNEININCMGMLIIDLNFTRKDFTQMYKWIKAVGLKHVAYSIFTPLPGSELYDQYKDKLITDDLQLWDYVHLVTKPEHLSVKTFYFHYFILVAKSIRLSQKYGVYNFMDWRKLRKDFFKLLIKGK